MSKVEVRTSYDLFNFPAFDAAVNAAAGRQSDFSGAGCGRRDLGWVCASDIEAARIARALMKIGLQPTIDKTLQQANSPLGEP